MSGDVDRSGSLSALARLKRRTPARIGLGRAGTGLPTDAHLDFAEAHAAARDAVHAVLDWERLAERLAAHGPLILVDSEAGDRATYLKRPDLGRRLANASRERLVAARREGEGEAGADDAAYGFDVVLIVADGLSAFAVEENAARTLGAFLDAAAKGWRIAPITGARQARVALSDPIGDALGARLAVMLVGERPGLSAADSLGCYLTFGPKPGRADAERNCFSNIRAGGLAPEEAGRRIADLAARALEAGFSGTRLKDDSGFVAQAIASPEEGAREG